MYTIMKNDVNLLEKLLESSKGQKFNLKGQDFEGKSAAHFVVNPLPFGSFENVEILNILQKSGFDLQLKDIHGNPPSYYASL